MEQVENTNDFTTVSSGAKQVKSHAKKMVDMVQCPTKSTVWCYRQ